MRKRLGVDCDSDMVDVGRSKKKTVPLVSDLRYSVIAEGKS